MPTYMDKASVNINEIQLAKKLFVENEIFGAITDINVEAKGQSVTIATPKAGYCLDHSGNIISTTKFDKPASKVLLIGKNSESDKFKYLNRGSWGSKSRLYDSDGKTVWTANERDGVDDTAFGDLSDNPRGKFVIGYNGGGGVSLLDQNGRELWNKPDGNVWHVEITESRKQKASRIVHSNAGGQITVRDGAGQVLHATRAPFYFSNFSLCHWPNSDSEQYLLSFADGNIWLLNLNGSVIRKFPVPVNDLFNESKAVLFRTGKERSLCLASLTSWHQWDRSLLCIHDAQGKLIYEEVIPETCQSISSSTVGQTDAIFIGGKNKIWQYAFDQKNVDAK